MDRALIRRYADKDERAWVVCRVLSFLDTAYYDDVRQAKEHYERAAIELVAVIDSEIVGLLDVECEDEPGTICQDQLLGLGGMIWHLAVHPDHQRRGIATALLSEAERQARNRGLSRLEAWTRDDSATRAWYEARGFEHVQSYLNVFVELDEGVRELFPNTAEGLRAVRVFAHALGNPVLMRERFRRVHENVLFERRLT